MVNTVWKLLTQQKKATINFLHEKYGLKAGEMSQRLRAFSALTEDTSSVPSIHAVWLRTTYNSSFRGSAGTCTHV